MGWLVIDVMTQAFAVCRCRQSMDEPVSRDDGQVGYREMWLCSDGLYSASELVEWVDLEQV